MSAQNYRKRFVFFVFLFITFLIGGLFIFFSSFQNNFSKNPSRPFSYFPKQNKQSRNSTVLGSNTQLPQIYISGGDQGYTSGGIIALSSIDEPAVVIGGRERLSGEVEIKIYEANENALLEYLIHDKDGKQLKKDPDISQFRYLTSVKQNIHTTSYQGSKILLPLGEIGIWYLEVLRNSTTTKAFVIRSDTGILAKEGNNEFIFWGQNFRSRRSISEGTISILNLQDLQKELQTVSFGTDGVAKANLTSKADIAFVKQGSDRAIIPLNLKYLNTGYLYDEFKEKTRVTRYFVFTDRPLYKPGDTIYFKSIMRDDDDARYSIPTGRAIVKIYDGYGEEHLIFEKGYAVSADGTIHGEYKLSSEAKTGYYRLVVSMPESTESTASFDVQFFRKPEFSIDVTAPKTELIAGDQTSFTISGTYFSGQPLMQQEVKYQVNSSDFYEYEYATDQQNYARDRDDDYRYGNWYGYNEKKVIEGTARLDKYGKAQINLNTTMGFNDGKSQVFSVEATIEDGSLNPSFSRKNILVYAGEYGIYRKDAVYRAKVNIQQSLPLALIPYRDNGNIANISLSAKVHRTQWVSFQEPDKKYPSYKKVEEDLPSLSAKTDTQGNAVLTFVPTKIGSYSITVEGKDARNNQISKVFYVYVSAEDQPYYNSDSDKDTITLSLDKQKYLPTDTVRLNIFSEIPDRDAFLSLERERVNRFQIVHFSGKNASVDIPLVVTDIPNIYAKASSFSNSALDSNTQKIIVSPDSKKLRVDVTPSSKTFGPGETANVTVSTTDTAGNPVSTDLAIWAVDKAIFELYDDTLRDIFDTFWYERSNLTREAHSLEGISVEGAEMGGGCFGAGTKVLMEGGATKNIEEVKVGEYVLTRSEKDTGLVKARVSKTHKTDVSGYLILNKNLKVTANHILRVNDTWLEAGSVQIGDMLVGSDGKHVDIESIEWQRGRFTVYNLEIEKHHTYFANGIWVHNEKGIEREIFKDTAYWNPSVHTDASGRAQVRFTLPDNLTTWVVAAVAATVNTQVGQTTSELIVTKDVIVRPIVPNILRTGDEVILSALVQNFTMQDHTFDIDLKYDSGEVMDTAYTNTLIKSEELQQLYWRVIPKIENNASNLVFSARAQDNKKLADVVAQKIPVRAFGFEEKRAEFGEGEKDFLIKLAPDSDKKKTKITLSLSPTIIGTLPKAMQYLIEYPYGCVEQTTSRFVPAVIAKSNQEFFAEALKGKNIDDIIQKGVARLETLQSGGGWAWWSSGDSNAFITAYVIEYLLQARLVGINVDDEIFTSAKNFFEREEHYDSVVGQTKTFKKEDIIAKNYALTLLGEKSKIKKIEDFTDISPDLLSLLVMTNYLNGDTNPQTNGLMYLISQAQTQGDAVFWEEGSKLNFGSKDASTALAIRAIVLAGGDRNLAVKAVRYLIRTRKSDYWSNTFATAQVVRALVDLSKTGDELTPNYTYTVSLDEKKIVSGTVSNLNKIITEIEIPASSIKNTGSSLSIVKSGDGQIYSTLAIYEFHTDKNAQPLHHGLSVKREYLNERGESQLMVGDVATVQITIAGLNANEYYGVIHDELPAGLVPINESFKNEEYGRRSYNGYGVSDSEITENGMTLLVYRIAPGAHVYTYKARAVSGGTFIVPPAVASLMYAPEIFGRSATQTVTIAEQSEYINKRSISTINDGITALKREKYLDQKVNIVGGLFIILVLIIFLILRKKGITAASWRRKIKTLFKKDDFGSGTPEPQIKNNSEGDDSS